METYRILLNEGEIMVIKYLLKSFKNSAIINRRMQLLINDKDAATLSELVQDKLVLEGFDRNYDVNAFGIILENLIDKFFEIGW